MKTCTHRLYADGEWLVCDVCSADFPHQGDCPIVPCVCDLRGEFDFASFSASNITDRVLDDMREEMGNLARRAEVAEKIARGNLDSYRDAVKSLHRMQDAVAAVRRIHHPIGSAPKICSGCGDDYPCDTVRAVEAL